MARLLLLADSNFLNNIGDYGGQKVKDLEVRSCQSRRAAMLEISTMEEGIVVFSCLDMVAADIAKTVADDASDAIEVYYNQVLHKMIEKIDMAEGKLAFGVVAPIFWTTHSEVVKRSMNHAYKLMKKASLENIFFTEYLKGVNAGPDGVHLTSVSSKHYIKNIMEFFQRIGTATGIGPCQLEGSEPVATSSWAEDLPAGQDPEAVNSLAPPQDSEMVSPSRTLTMLSASMLAPTFGRPVSRAPTGERLMRMAHQGTEIDVSIPPPRIDGLQTQDQAWYSQDVISSLRRIERRVGTLEAKTFYDNVMMAGLKEEQDSEANKAMLNRVILSKISMPNLQGLNEEGRIRSIKDRINEIIESVKANDKEYKVLFVRHLNRKVRGQIKGVIEVKLESPQQAADFRADFVKKQKESEEERSTRMNINPVVRLATRVRIEILHSVVDLLKKHDTTIDRAMCLQYIPKTVIKIIRKTMAGTETVSTMTFIEAVCWVKLNNYCDTIKLNRAYERAGAKFRGTMTQHFVLMSSTLS